MADTTSSTIDADLKKPISFRLVDPLAAQTFLDQAAKANLKPGEFARQLVVNGIFAQPSELAAVKADLVATRSELRRLARNVGIFASIILSESLDYDDDEIKVFLASTFEAS